MFILFAIIFRIPGAGIHGSGTDGDECVCRAWDQSEEGGSEGVEAEAVCRWENMTGLLFGVIGFWGVEWLESAIGGRSG